MIALIVFVVALMGFAGLALSARRHHNVVPFLKPYRTQLRLSGWVFLAASLAIAIIQPRSSIMAVEWMFLLTAAGIPVVAAMTLYASQNKNAR